ncbi:hypothetical protein N825_07990 [Skermanella stibiiresistens SB22]|uniref:HTH HARE-type domain-containing protein n=1 Tax=Skermanella stibiiresistens SB22 TaxID=1385369 RepID=W9H6B4_9PROT|nr:hypothetical protein [Skermanella stibiiresistens]EWY39303.1 hypothetical protein N825_07990 [Skermanella stibiiresistens SB22]
MVSALVEKRSELAGQIAEMEKRIARHQADLIHIDAVLRMYGKDDPETIKPKDIGRRSDWFRPRECARLIQDILRDAPGPVLTRDVALRIMEAKGIDQGDPQVVNTLKRSVLGALKRMRDLEKVSMDGAVGWSTNDQRS